MAPPAFDRTREDVGNIVALEHVNVTVPDQRLAALFYVVGLGFTRDPYLMVGDWNMWVNLGRQQFHLPNGSPQVLRGVVGVVVPDLDRVRQQLARVAPALAGTRFALDDAGAHLDLVCPWGNRIRCHAPGPRFPGLRLGMPYVEFEVPGGGRRHRALLPRDFRRSLAGGGRQCHGGDGRAGAGPAFP